MEITRYIVTVLAGSSTIGVIIVFLGKTIITKSSDIILANHKNKLDLLKIEHQIRFSKLNEERGNVIKEIFQSLYNLEEKLKTLTTTAQGPDWINDNVREESAIKQLNQTKDLLEVNRIFFSENQCNSIEKTLNECLDVIDRMCKAKQNYTFREQIRVSGGADTFTNDDENPLKIWQSAEKKVKKEIKEERLKLAKEFRDLIGVK